MSVRGAEETDVKIDQFQGVYLELLSASIRRCTLSTTQDPFLAEACLQGDPNDGTSGGGVRACPSTDIEVFRGVCAC